MQNTYRKYVWKDGKILEYGKRTLVMGILNVTPDSFSDGGLWNSPEKALRHALQMVEDGADIIAHSSVTEKKLCGNFFIA